MRIEKFIKDLQDREIFLSVAEGEVKVKARTELLTSEILSEVKLKKNEILTFYSNFNGSSGYISIPRCKEKPWYQPSSAQKRLHFIYEFDRASVAYNMPQVARIDGELDYERLENAFKKLLVRHEGLRTSFEFRDDEVMQIINHNVDFEMEYFESSQAEVGDVVKKFVRPFQLDKTPLMRAGLIRVSDESHVLMVDSHHIVTDGISHTTFVKDFVRFYQGEELLPLNLRYRDYSEWLHGKEQQRRLAQQVEFWKNEFAGEVSVLATPTDFPRPRVKSYRGKNISFSIDRPTTKKLRTIGENIGSTMFMTLLSVYNVLLSKIANQQEITVGIQVSGRDHADMEGIVGVFINALALRNFPKGELSFNEFLSEVQAKAKACLANRSYPYEELIEELKLVRDTSRHPLFDVMFMYENIQMEESAIPGLRLSPLESPLNIAKFDFTLNARELDDQLLFDFEYSTDLFREETIHRFIGYFRQIIDSVTAEPTKKLSEIQVVAEDESRRLMYEFNDTSTPYARDRSIVKLFDEIASVVDDQPAVVFNGRTISYKELNELSDRLASYLVTFGVTKGSVVGLLLDRSVEMIVGIIGIMKSGAAYLPIDPKVPAQRVQYMLEQCGSELLLTQEHYMGMHSARVTTRNINSPELYARNVDNKPSHSATDLAYCIFTSGSTGEPKGVMMEHRGIVNLVKGLEEKVYRKYTQRQLKVGLLASYSFDASCQQIFAALLQGHTLVICDDIDKQDGLRLAEFFNSNEIDTSDGTPTHLRLLVNSLNESPPLTTLSSWIMAGEMLPKELVREFISGNRGSKVRLFNFYGPTETCVDSTCYEVTAKELEEHSTIPIGKPLPNERVFLVDPYGNLVPTGTIGELCIAGDGVARGYIGDSALTKLKFPAGWIKGEARVYRTGDLAKWLPDGNLEYAGRADRQTKIRGYRIEMAEIERQLIAHKDISNTVCHVRELNQEKWVVAYYESSSKLEVPDLRHHISSALPDYMVPSFFVHVEKMPINSNGKIDIGALANLELTLVDDYKGPSTEIERTLVTIWSEILNLDESKISVNKSFFELGGHSLNATVLTNKIAKKLGVAIPLREVFIHQDVASLAVLVAKSESSQYLNISKAPRKHHYVLSSAQRRLYFLYEFDKLSLAYNMPQAVRLTGDVNRERLEDAFRKLIDRHESLRTQFELVGSEFVQIINDKIDFRLDYFEGSESEVHDIADRFIRPFDLGKSPLIRAGLIKITANDYILMVDMHHIITDGVSQAILIKDFMALYDNASLPNQGLQYKDYADWQRSDEQQIRLKHQKAFWLKEFASEVKILDLPADFARPQSKSFNGAMATFHLSAEETKALNAISERFGATTYMILLAIYNILANKLTDQQDIVIASPIANRQHADLQNVIGMFVNTLAIRNEVKREFTFLELLSNVKAKALACFENQTYQFEDLVEELKVPRDPSRNPLTDIVLTFQNFEETSLLIPGVGLQSYGIRRPTTKFDLTLFGWSSGGRIGLSFEYSTDLFKSSTIERYISYFKAITSAVIADLNVKVGDIDITTEEEKQRLLNEFNSTAKLFPESESLHQMFAKQAKKTPGSTALIHGSDSLTYEELDRRSNQLAWLLVKKGVYGRNIGILLDSSFNMIVSILAVLKSGNAYVPIDPRIPENRITWMTKDAEIDFMLSEKKYVKLLNRLQWESHSLKFFVCIDSTDIYSEKELTANTLKDEKLWNFVAERAGDAIARGGWQSSYTGLDLSKEEMDEYSENAFLKLKPLLKPTTRVLEIGCASGLTMFKVAPHVGFYYGTDLSGKTIEINQQIVDKEGYKNIALARKAAHEIDEIEQGDFDLIIINSVIQAFDGHNYLRQVLDKAVALMKDDGYIFCGDIMDQERKNALIFDVEQFARKNADKGYKSKNDFSEELFLSKSFFSDLCIENNQIESASFSDKRHTIENELTKFRYDALLKVNKPRKGKRELLAKVKFQLDGRAIASLPDTPVNVVVDLEQTAYIIYTSGSTGTPNGVMVPHRSVINLFESQRAEFNIRDDEKILQASSVSFDASVEQIWLGLLTGSSLVLISKDTLINEAALNDYLRAHGVTHLHSTPSFLSNISIRDNTTLRRVIAGGEQCSIELAGKYGDRYDFYNEYGPTETTVTSIEYKYREVDKGSNSFPIGRPIANTEALILSPSDDKKLQPIGVAGELYIGGTGLTKGYVNNNALTAKRFVPHPFRDNKLLYKTGDLARWLPDGNIEYLGRIDDQVKIRGFRIELGEIETQLMNHPKITEARVIAREKEGDKYLVTYYVSAERLDSSELVRFLSALLPEYMVPAFYVPMDHIPLNSNGKLDKKALPNPEVKVDDDYVAPANETERKLVAVWSEVLKIDKAVISVKKSFFEMGGHSLKAVYLVNKISKELDIDVTLQQVFKTSTIRELSELTQVLAWSKSSLSKEEAGEEMREVEVHKF